MVTNAPTHEVRYRFESCPDYKTLNDMILVKENKGFAVYFDYNSQTYTVTKDGKFLIGNKHKFSQIKSYLD